MINHRISAGGIVVQNNKVLLVHHYHINKFDFWVMPGGGIESDEGIYKAAEREVLEETGLAVTAERIAYIEELIDEGNYVCKLWVYCNPGHGNLRTDYKDADETFLREAYFFSKDEIQNTNVFPPILKDSFWEDLSDGFSSIKYIGYEMTEESLS
jgi:ADP-ribose pyrophosphatase YjhB (NUDIX family)